MSKGTLLTEQNSASLFQSTYLWRIVLEYIGFTFNEVERIVQISKIVGPSGTKDVYIMGTRVAQFKLSTRNGYIKIEYTVDL